MSLAQVVYKITNDSDFAAKWLRNPEAALEGNGFHLTQEEYAFLAKGLRQVNNGNGQSVRLSELVLEARSWRD